MNWGAKIFRYCERGADPGLWAEPANAVSNAAFIIAAIAAAIVLVRARRGDLALPEWFLTTVLVVIGIGSFLFHTFATRWSAIADVAPIGVFMFAYLAYALRRLLRAPWVIVAMGLALFAAAMHYAGEIDCRPALLSVTAAARGPCLNGTVGYVPAFLAMIVIGAMMALRGRAGAWHLLLAASVFFVSMVFRTVDFEVCALTRVGGHVFGTHFLWHILNATTLFLLLLAGIRHGAPKRQAEAPLHA